jgi:hypothetical protein
LVSRSEEFPAIDLKRCRTIRISAVYAAHGEVRPLGKLTIKATNAL